MRNIFKRPKSVNCQRGDICVASLNIVGKFRIISQRKHELNTTHTFILEFKLKLLLLGNKYKIIKRERDTRNKHKKEEEGRRERFVFPFLLKTSIIYILII